MKNLILVCFLLLSISTISQNEESFELNTNQSTINWRGYYAFLFSEHTGTVVFKSGELITKHGNITGGTFAIDMTSITNEDYERNGEGPVEHLKDPDFFDVKKFPDAFLKITSVEYFPEENLHKLMADLTIKGVTKKQEIWAKVDGEQKLMTTKFKIDRNRWGISYNNDLRDHAIADAIEFDVKLHFE